MKKLVSLILTLALCLCALASCSLFGSVAEAGDVTVVIETEDGKYEVYKTYLEDVENKSEGVVGVLEHLKSREDNPLPLNMYHTIYAARGMKSSKYSIFEKNINQIQLNK